MAPLPPRSAALAALALAAAPALAAAQPRLTTPAVPSFELPPEAPGYHGVRELRVRGDRLLGTEVTVRGYVTWIYDCAKQIARPKEKPAQVQKRIDADPTLCERPKLYLGATKDASRERSIWVANVPRAPNRLERQRLPRAELAQWPAVPKLALGDHVAITGTWAQTSPHGDRSSDGLLVFKALQPAPPAPPALPAAAPPPGPRIRPAPPRVPPAPRRAPIGPVKRTRSLQHVNAGTRAVAQLRYDDAIREYKAAAAAWPENESAWYWLALAHARKREWSQAAAAVARATQLLPGNALYQQVHGMMLYEATVQRAREAQATAQGRPPDEVELDERTLDHGAALDRLVLSAHLDPRLWRTHYYLGRIHRQRGDARAAAEAFDAAVRAAPEEAAPYVALSELYRRWDYLDEAIAVARLGAATLTAPGERGDALYMLGFAHDEKREDAEATLAYTKALEARPDLGQALFMRAQVHLRTSNRAAAKADLEALLAHPRARPQDKAAAQQLLGELARGKP